MATGCPELVIILLLPQGREPPEPGMGSGLLAEKRAQRGEAGMGRACKTSVSVDTARVAGEWLVMADASLSWPTGSVRGITVPNQGDSEMPLSH